MWWELFFFDPVQRGRKAAPLEILLKTLGSMPEELTEGVMSLFNMSWDVSGLFYQDQNPFAHVTSLTVQMGVCCLLWLSSLLLLHALLGMNVNYKSYLQVTLGCVEPAWDILGAFRSSVTKYMIIFLGAWVSVCWPLMTVSVCTCCILKFFVWMCRQQPFSCRCYIMDRLKVSSQKNWWSTILSWWMMLLANL